MTRLDRLIEQIKSKMARAEAKRKRRAARGPGFSSYAKLSPADRLAERKRWNG